MELSDANIDSKVIFAGTGKTWKYPEDKDSIPFPAVYADTEDEGVWIAYGKGELLYIGDGGFLDKGEGYEGTLRPLPPQTPVTITLQNNKAP